MAYIEVNHRELRDYADRIDEYCKLQISEMNSAIASVSSMLVSDWNGEDSLEFKDKWRGVNDKDSVAGKLQANLENFSNCLRSCAKEYQKAQEDSYNEASRLKWWC